MTYSHKQNGPNMDIFRDEVHIATFDPIEEAVTYTDDDHKRFRKPINDYLKKVEVVESVESVESVDPATTAPEVKAKVDETQWGKYKRKGLSEMLPVEKFETLEGISVSDEDRKAGSPKHGDMIARNPKNHDDKWLVAKKYFDENLELEEPKEERRSAHHNSLKRENMRLKLENVKLQDEVAKLRGDQATSIQRVPDRYSDEFDDSKGVELKGPHGDMTPKYVEWARKNMPKEIFARRYRGRLKK